jgi:hypothetical protein
MNIARRTIITLTCLSVFLFIRYADAWSIPSVSEVGIAAKVAGAAAARGVDHPAVFVSKMLEQHANPEAHSEYIRSMLPPSLIERDKSVKVFGIISKFMFAKAHVKKFGKKFMNGTKEPSAYLDILRKRNPQLVEQWLSVPRNKRIFIVGAGKDEVAVSKISDHYKNDGFETFFYKDCVQFLKMLCSEEEVGVLFATSGHVIAIKSPYSDVSPYIQVELAAINIFNTGGALIIFDTDTILRVVKDTLDTVSYQIDTQVLYNWKRNLFIQMREKPRLFRAGMDSAAAIAAFGIS